MLAYKEGSPADFRSAYQKLWREHKKGFRSFSTLDMHMDWITQGRFLVLRNRFELKTQALLRDGEPMLLATLFLPHPGWPDRKFPASLGAIVAAAGLRPEESAFFWEEFARRHSGHKPVGPMNGHHYLGFGLPPSDARGEKIAFQMPAPHRGQEKVFGRFRPADPYRRFYSFETRLTPHLLNRLSLEITEVPKGIRVRGFRPWNARRDIAILNDLVNTCFTRHFDFAPLTEAENWEIFRNGVPLMSSRHLLFLEDSGRPIGFCLGMRDYNRVLKNDADWKNIARLVVRRPVPRGRLVHIGILPEYQGQGLIKQVRHRIMLAFAAEGMDVVENSYVDEGNCNSLGNVRSTGAEPLYTFTLQRLAE